VRIVDEQLKVWSITVGRKLSGLTVHSSLIEPDMNSGAILTIQNDKGSTERVPEGSILGEAIDALHIIAPEQDGADVGTVVREVRSDCKYDDDGELQYWKRLSTERDWSC